MTGTVTKMSPRYDTIQLYIISKNTHQAILYKKSTRIQIKIQFPFVERLNDGYFGMQTQSIRLANIELCSLSYLF